MTGITNSVEQRMSDAAQISSLRSAIRGKRAEALAITRGELRRMLRAVYLDGRVDGIERAMELVGGRR